MEFDEFFGEERDGLVRLCWLLTLDREAAADIAQEAMARAWASWDTLSDAGSNPAGWVRTVATNLSRSRWRRLRRASLLRWSPYHSTSELAVSDPALLDALGELSPRQREVVVLRYWADMKLADCAEAMGVSLGSVKQHLARAHVRLGELVDPSSLEGLRL